jgi:hypothetical protein
MARFYAEIDGAARTRASRLGHKRIWSHTRGWNCGATVEATADGDRDVIAVGISSGSNGSFGAQSAVLTIENDNKGGRTTCRFRHPDTGETTEWEL